MNTPFDPSTQFEQVLTQADIEIMALRSTLDRLLWLRVKIADEFTAMQNAADTLDLYTEEQAAAILQVKPDLLGTLRRRHLLAHVNFGNRIRYTKDQLRGICEFLTINKKERRALKHAA